MRRARLQGPPHPESFTLPSPRTLRMPVRSRRHNPYKECSMTPTEPLLNFSVQRTPATVAIAFESCSGDTSQCRVTEGVDNIHSLTTTAEPRQTNASHHTKSLDAVADHYKTRLCRSFQTTGTCRLGVYCRFAHGASDLRTYAQNAHAGIVSEGALRVYQELLAARAQRAKSRV